jgi:HD-GYP domain-containing protein (c-di-GMP phosphodiesterase class II)
MAYREISVDELRFGMYVAKLDRPWTDTPFMFQGFVLQNEKQLETLKRFCKKVFVDPEKVDRKAEEEAVERAAAAVRGSTVYKETVTVESELPRAERVYERSTVVVTEIARTVPAKGTVDTERSQQASQQITESVVRNPDAMTLLTKMQEKGSGVLSRAVEVSVMMTVFGRFLQYSQEQLHTLSMLGLLQDVGKLRLPAPMLKKTTSWLAQEQELFKTHVNHSVEILSKTTGLPPDFPGLASLHHERYDGTGYPRGLKGNAINLLGAIAGLVDAYDMLVAPPPWGENMTPSTALGVLYRNRGVKFTPGLVEQFIQCMGAFPVGSVIEMQTGEIGVVISQNPVKRLQPRIMLVHDANGTPIKPHLVLDLTRGPKASDGEPYRIRRTLDQSTVKIDPKELFL